jgi:tetratricopeptide (TPR) repeat protein
VSKSAAIGLAIALGAFSFTCHATAQTAPSDLARESYRKGAQLYKLGQFEAASEAFEQAYALSGAKRLLFNIAQAHRLAGPGHCERALRAYTNYLREEPDTSNAEEVRRRIEEMKVCSEREHVDPPEAALVAGPITEAPPRPTAPPRTAQPAPVLPRSGARSLAPIVTTVAGAGLGLTGGILYWRVRVKYSEVEGQCPCPEGRFSGWQTITNASYALMAVGGTALVGGAIWWALDREKPQAARYGLMLEPSGVRLFGKF